MLVKYPDLIKTLKSSSPEVQAYIVDRCKQIFAKERLYSHSSIGQILTAHKTVKEVLTNLKGPSGEIIPSELASELISKRSEWKSSKASFSDTPKQDENLIGYSAFYRWNKATGKYISKNFSLTSLGGTGYQGELYTIKEHPDQAKDWVINNLKNNEQEMKTFKDRIDTLCKQENISVDLSKSDRIDKLID